MIDTQLYNDYFLNTKRLAGDPPADDFIRHVFANAEKRLLLQQFISGKEGSNLQSLKDSFPGFDLIHRADVLPSWAEPRLMQAGAAFFARHAQTIMTLLGLLSLPYCYTAANGAMVLYLSELIKKQTTKRLHDTAVFVWEVMAPDAFGEGKAYEEILKVRMMHAAVRYYTLQSGKWDDAWGLPINQEDMAGTNLSFSLIVIRGLRMMGISVSEADQAAYLHTWAVIGYLMGLEEEMIPRDAKAAQYLDSAIKDRQFKDSEHGQELTQSLTDHILEVNKGKATPNEVLGLMRYLLGTDIADLLAIKSPDLPRYKLRLLKTVNLVKSLAPKGDSRTLYRAAYHTFKMQNAKLVKTH